MEFRIKPDKLMAELMPLSLEERGKFISRAVYAMVQGKYEAPWIVKGRQGVKKALTVNVPYTEAFKAFWKEYPKKKNKGKAFEVWQAIDICPSELRMLCLNALSWQRESMEWVKNDGEFIPNPENYLKARKWEDENPNQGAERYQDMNGVWRTR